MNTQDTSLTLGQTRTYEYPTPKAAQQTNLVTVSPEPKAKIQLSEASDAKLNVQLTARTRDVNLPKFKTEEIERVKHIASQSNSLAITCADTGIAGTIDMPAVKGFYLEYTHPLAKFSSALAFSQTEKKYVSKNTKEVIAGAIITILKEYKLLRMPNQPMLLLNMALSQAKKETLVGVLYCLGNKVSLFPTHYAFSPLAASEYITASKGADSHRMVNGLLGQFLRHIEAACTTRQVVDEDSISTSRKDIEQAAAHNKARLKAIQQTNSELEKVQEAKKAAKETKAVKAYKLKDCLPSDDLDGKSVLNMHIEQLGKLEAAGAAGVLFRKLAKTLKQSGVLTVQQEAILSNVSQALGGLEQSVCDKLAPKLKTMDHMEAKALAHILEAFTATKAEDVLDMFQTSDLPEAPTPKKQGSLAERLAARKAARQSKSK